MSNTSKAPIWYKYQALDSLNNRFTAHALSVAFVKISGNSNRNATHPDAFSPHPPRIAPQTKMQNLANTFAGLAISQQNRQPPPPSPAQVKRERWERAPLENVELGSGVKRDKKVLTNFLGVQIPANVRLFKYRIELGKFDNRKVKNPEFKRTLITEMLRGQPPTAAMWCSDYNTYVVSVGKLYRQFVEVKGVAYSVTAHHQTHRDGQVVTVTMDNTVWDEGTLDMGKLNNYIRKIAAGTTFNPAINASYLPEEDLRILNLVSWANINGSLFSGGRVGKKFYPEPFRNAKMLGRDSQGRAVSTDKNTNAWYVLSIGFFTSMRPGTGSILLNVNPTTSAFYPAVLLSSYIQLRWKDFSDRWRRFELKGIRVRFTERASISLTIFDFSNRSMRNHTFMLDDARETSVANHMRDTYPTSTFNLDAECVNCGTALKPAWFPVDKLEIQEWQVVRTPLDTDFKRLMVQQAERSPNDNLNTIKRKALGPLGISNLEAPSGSTVWPLFYRDFRLGVDSKFMEIQARILKEPRLVFERGDGKKTVIPRNASWNLESQRFLHVHQPSPILGILRLTKENNSSESKSDMTALEMFSEALLKSMKACGFEKPGLAGCGIQSATIPTPSNTIDYRTKLVAVLDLAFKPLQNGSAHLLIVVLPDNDPRVYSNIKWWGDCMRGIITCCVTSKSIGKKNRNSDTVDSSMLGNICLKINSKLRGASHTVAGDESYVGAKDGTMIIGADVSHPGKGREPNPPSMAGIVATCDDKCIHYYPSARLQSANTEHIEDLKGMIKERLFKYYYSNGNSFPAHILFYRDGVSESQYGMVKLEELPQVREAYNAAVDYLKIAITDRKPPPKVTILVVGKRHHARFYPTDNKKQVEAGLVVDTDVVNPNYSNFYLQSHDSPKGTARSAHYVVIENESGYNLKELEELTNKICYTGARATKALSVCTPARYADILCDRLRVYMKPALDRAQLNLSESPSVEEFANHGSTWKPVNDEKKCFPHPWSKQLLNSMFYL